MGQAGLELATLLTFPPCTTMPITVWAAFLSPVEALVSVLWEASILLESVSEHCAV